MPKSDAIKALAKVMIAAAWADGEISIEEMNSLKDLLFHLPEMTASDWAELDIYIETPVGDAERARLVADLQSSLRTSQDKELAMAMIDELAGADGDISAEERASVEEIKAGIREANIGVLGSMGNFLGRSVNRRSKAVSAAPNRELYLDDYVKNKVYYSISRRLELEETAIGIPDKELRRLSLAGGLMARVAYVDQEVQEGEFDSMVKAIKGSWQLTDIEAALVAETAVSTITRGLDYYRLSRRFFESTTEEERVRFMDALFAVADADGRVSYEEIEEIRTIATVLKLSHKQFIDAKLKIPRERRAN
ncbi:MAG: TerB family tellurite resistance protein [Anaerolineales bacterium]